MDFFDIISLLGGLALFLYGMNILSNGLDKLAGGKMEQILKTMTSSKLKGLLLGMGVTAAIQSSSALTVMLVGLVNSGIMQLSQAISVTMGSNIGTTITAWILSLAGIDSDVFILKILKPSTFSPIVAFIGIALMMIAKAPKKKDIGSICLGFAVLMFGMEMMSDSVSPLAEMPGFRNILTAFSNPILGVLAGAIFTAAIQSSSASVGVLQAISITGSLTYGAAIPIIMGQNIGTCISALMASIGANKNARRVAVVHVLFNCIGTVVFLLLWTIINGLFKFDFVSTAISPFYIAIIHTIFNVLTTALLLPFASVLESLAYKILKDDKKKDTSFELLDERLMTVPAFAVANASAAAVKMASFAKKAVNSSMVLLEKYDEKSAEEIKELEDILDKYEDKMGSYLVVLSKKDMNSEESNKVSMLLHTIGDFERIGDYALSIADTAKEMFEKNAVFSPQANKEIKTLLSALNEIIDITAYAFENDDNDSASLVEPLEQVVDALVNEIRSRHIIRLRSGNCTIELGFILSDLLTSIRRVSDHCSNIAVAIIESKQGSFDTHKYLGALKSQTVGSFVDSFKEFREKYSLEDKLI